MIKDKKGLSAVVTTLILVLLVIVAIAIIWAVIRPLLTNPDIDIRQKCIENIVTPKEVICSEFGNCLTMKVERVGTGDDEIAGVIVGVEGDKGKKTVIDKSVLGLGGIITVDIDDIVSTDIGANPDKAEARVYFLNDANEEKKCEATVVDFTAKECVLTSECATNDKGHLCLTANTCGCTGGSFAPACIGIAGKPNCVNGLCSA